MLNESDGTTNIRQWKKFVNMYCPRCYRTGDHRFIRTSGLRTAVRRSHSGTLHLAQYKCQTDDCGQVVEVEIFIRFDVQTMHMFPPQDSDDFPF